MNKVPKVSIRSYIEEINKQIDKGVFNNQKNAAKFLVKELKEVVGESDNKGIGFPSLPGTPPRKQSGNLQKGIGYAHDRSYKDIETKVGFRSPAHHAHLMEFGTDARYQKTWKKKTLKKEKFVGHVAPRPFFVSTIMKNLDKVKEILSEPVL